MTLRPQEVVRTEVEGELSGPANSLTPESIDCGCGGYKLPQLAKFATRRVFLSLLCTIGFLQATSQAYLYVVSSSIARRFLIDPYLMEWILYLSEIVPLIIGLAVAYWGDKIHRASWLGGLTLIQCAALLSLIIPHISHSSVKVIEDTTNVTHMPTVYSEESPDLCMKMFDKLLTIKNAPLYTTISILVIVQIITGIANVAYYALGISYLDDNSKKEQIAVYLGFILGIRILGSILGYMVGWGFLRIDANSLHLITSYRSQIGAWWLGWPIFAFLLMLPAVPMAIFPRKLPSELVEETAASILDQSGTLRRSQRLTVKKVGSPEFLPSMIRLLTNKILIFNILAVVFFVTALVNFMVNENIYLESRFYAPRPNGILMGFEDPLLSRTLTTILKPFIVGLSVIIAGLVIARVKPNVRTLIVYDFIILGISALVIFSLAFNNCEKPPIVGYKVRGSLSLPEYCNRDCRCSQDADFRPICDKIGSNTYYSPCHAGCTTVTYGDNKMYGNCSCIQEKTGLIDGEAHDGPCGSNSCQMGWIVYELFTVIIYATASSTIIGDLLISLRSINPQDKALTIGYGLMFLGLFAYILGKISYDELAKTACVHWGIGNSVCHLHSSSLGYYLCFLTAGLIVISALLKIGVWFFCRDLEIYDLIVVEEQQLQEMKEMSQTQQPLLQSKPDEPMEAQSIETVDSHIEPMVIIEHKKQSRENGPITDAVEGETSESKLQYGPIGPGLRRVTENQPHNINADTDDDLDSSDGSQNATKISTDQVSYKPLQVDSDSECELNESARKRIPSIEASRAAFLGLTSPQEIYPPFSNMRFPNPANYEDLRAERISRNNSPNPAADGSVKTNSLEFTRKPKENKDKSLSASRGDFNEVGIPLVESYESTVKGSTSSLRSPTIMMAIQHLDRNSSRELLEQTRFVYQPKIQSNSEEDEENHKFRLEKLMQSMNYSPDGLRPPSRDQASSGFGSLQDMRERMQSHGEDSRDSLSSKSSLSSQSLSPKKKGGPLCTDL
ncbi:solute carrier organic anion transporter family member 2A1-like [Phymastichus coffea]|uniref:solute carrier organic anion transporter family member 2A1-like n=1 Tax=Phymastichus coffea TaxID=108790 RepID=UPI00273C871C|nr:solute carrier organic anion transporter family member 2A1-like [Phymastichus coffea]